MCAIQAGHSVGMHQAKKAIVKAWEANPLRHPACQFGQQHCVECLDIKCCDNMNPSVTTNKETDLNTCPQCLGNADQGFSREIPPQPYPCTKCVDKDLTNTWKGMKVRINPNDEWVKIKSAYLGDKNELIFILEDGEVVGSLDVEFEGTE